MMKDIAIQIINALPDTVDMEEIIEALYIRMKVEKGLQDFEEGNLISHVELKKEISNWK